MINCRRLAKKTVDTLLLKEESVVLVAGWVGVNEQGDFLFRPARGTDGYVPYETAERAQKFTGCEKVQAVQVQLVLL